MNKKIIAVALAGAFITPLAMADVTLYGFISAGLESATASGTSAAANNTYVGRTRVSDENSRIGFKGTEDLGNGTKTVWQVESSLKSFTQGGTNDKGETATFATRNSFVGLSDATLGQLVLGYNDSAYKRYTNVGANVMADTTADISGDNGGVFNIIGRGYARLKNSVHYDSPTWAGIKFGASYGFDETTGNGRDAARASLGAAYTNGGLKIGAGWDRVNDSSASLSGTSGFAFKNNGNTTSPTASVVGTHVTYMQLGTSYTFETDTMLAAQIERADYGLASGASDMTQTAWTLAATQAFGNASIKLSYTKLGDLNNPTVGNPSDYDATQWVLGATYNLSKQTQLLAFATRIDNKALQNVNFSVNPLYTTPASGTTSATSLSPGNTLKAIGAGIKYNF
ncbi:MAG: porin [Paludibacterium sp.]|uniref:porin n=1 Tax=Paludibacterium sp. TaxID=1917523 RepID=UPI0025DADF11|nr:porin [Paludibacterium sp.]MBV8048868.1 porin [Paludibacterium sp.]MBV8648214.1 porin [Paludibacterium sp.]